MTRSENKEKAETLPCQSWCKRLRAENFRLLAKIRQLEGEITLRENLFGEAFVDKTFEEQELRLKATFPFYVELTTKEREIFRILYKLKGGIARKPAILATLCQLRPDADWPGEKVIDVYLCKIRRKMRGSGWHIETHWGEGLSLRKQEGLSK